MKRTRKAMIVAGVMSGTSADGVDVALARIAPGAAGVPKITLLGHRGFAYPRAVRQAVLRVMEGAAVTAGEISRLHWRLGGVYATCVAETQHSFGVQAQLIGLHGQTIYHQSTAGQALGAPVRATWQIGEAAVLRESLGMPVVSDFRPADLAAGGEGAPLVPMLDFCMFRSKKAGRVLLNLGGIANITVIPANAVLDQLLAYDTGPANMVIDALMHRFFSRRFDSGGRVASRGHVVAAVLRTAMRDPYFKRPAPKSCGREQFGAGFTERFAAECSRAGARAEDTIATATMLSVTSIAQEVLRCQRDALAGRPLELIAAGGGTHNRFMMEALKARLAEADVSVSTTETCGIDVQAKEAVAFALLAWLSRHGLPGNVPSATGALGPRLLGKLSC